MEKSGRKDSKDTVLDELVVLFIRAKPHGSQNVIKSGCNKNQENLNHKQMNVLPKSLVPRWANLTKQLYERSTANAPLQKRGHEPCKLNMPPGESKARITSVVTFPAYYEPGWGLLLLLLYPFQEPFRYFILIDPPLNFNTTDVLCICLYVICISVIYT